MKILICGAGRVGYSIASYLEKTKHDVIIIDHEGEKTRSISEKLDVRAIHGFASDPRIMKKAGAEDADMIIAVTQSDEVNMIACEVAHAVFKVPVKIARIRNQAYLSTEWNNLFQDKNLSVDVTISPEHQVAKGISTSLVYKGISSFKKMGKGHVNVISAICHKDTPLINTPIKHINSLFPDLDISIAGIIRDNQLIIPHHDDRIKKRDHVTFVCSNNSVNDAMAAMGYEAEHAKRIVIVGAGIIGESIALNLEDNAHADLRVTLIEKNIDRARDVARKLKNSDVLHGDALSQDMIAEANISKAEAVISVTNDDKVNILSSIMAKQAGAEHTFTLIKNFETIPMAHAMGLDTIINPREITVSTILSHIRQGYIRDVHAMRFQSGEIIEGIVGEESSLLGLSPDDVNVQGEIKICAVLRKDKVLHPSSQFSFEREDRLILVSSHKNITTVEKLFTARLEYF